MGNAQSTKHKKGRASERESDAHEAEQEQEREGRKGDGGWRLPAACMRQPRGREGRQVAALAAADDEPPNQRTPPFRMHSFVRSPHRPRAGCCGN